ncbi:MAG: bifunctional GNAT family N-acetyltransferase/ATP-binding protein [Acidimicrobiales bacterium]
MRAQPDTKPVDIAHFVSDVSSQAPIVVAVAGEAVVGLVSARVGHDAWIHVVAIAPAWRHRGIGSAVLARLEERLLHLGVRKVSALSSEQAGQAALVNRGFRATNGLVLYEKTEPLEPSAMRIVDRWGGELLDGRLWDDVAGMTREKELIESRVIAPLLHPDLAEGIGVHAPSTVMLYGPPGTGKTTFARAISGKLGWPFVELLPSKLGASEGALAAELRDALVELLQLDRVVVFIDEFDEIASRREEHPATKGVVNELLKTIPGFRVAPGRLLVCATNFVHAIDAAVLRPGRFDLLIPIGPPDDRAREALWRRALAKLRVEDGVDVPGLVARSDGYTPGDVALAAQRASGDAFDRARRGDEWASVTQDDLDRAVARTRPSVTETMAAAFRDEVVQYERV